MDLEILGFKRKSKNKYETYWEYNNDISDFFIEISLIDGSYIVAEKQEWRNKDGIVGMGSSTRNLFIGKLENNSQLIDILTNSNINNRTLLRELKINNLLK